MTDAAVAVGFAVRNVIAMDPGPPPLPGSDL